MRKLPPKIVEAATCSAQVTATVELLSTVFRPFSWRVTVIGRPPHAWVRVYDIAAATDDLAAREGMKRFIDETKRQFIIVTSL